MPEYFGDFEKLESSLATALKEGAGLDNILRNFPVFKKFGITDGLIHIICTIKDSEFICPHGIRKKALLLLISRYFHQLEKLFETPGADRMINFSELGHSFLVVLTEAFAKRNDKSQ
ncbi:MAG: hypothetical protein ABH956_01350 [Candidatus Nealsonbacteria bacterium]